MSLRSTNLGEMTKYQIDLDLIRFIKSSQLSRTLFIKNPQFSVLSSQSARDPHRDNIFNSRLPELINFNHLS